MEQAELDALMSKVGPLDPAIAECVRMPDGGYAVRFEDGDVIVEWDASRRRLVLSAEIGKPPASRAAAIHQTLLGYNLMWRETGGVRMALSGPKGGVVQIVDLAGEEIDPQAVARVCSNLIDRTRIWQAFFESKSGGDAPQPESYFGAIRA